MTDQELKNLAQQYVEEVYDGDTDFIDEAVSIIGWLLLDHCIVRREKFEEVFKELEDAYNSGDNDMVEYYIEELFNVVQKGGTTEDATHGA